MRLRSQSWMALGDGFMLGFLHVIGCLGEFQAEKTNQKNERPDPTDEDYGSAWCHPLSLICTRSSHIRVRHFQGCRKALRAHCSSSWGGFLALTLTLQLDLQPKNPLDKSLREGPLRKILRELEESSWHSPDSPHDFARDPQSLDSSG